MNLPAASSAMASPDSRTLRIFVSSTFRDMQAEREQLVKFAFPELRRRCRERGVELVEVDLRWGITEAQAERGEVLPVCLAEIRRCDYFVGLLGERYGFVPAHIDPALLEEQSWLAEHSAQSYTALEILHGVLNTAESAGHAFFYFRDTAYMERLPPETRCDYAPESPESQAKLAALKDQIRAGAEQGRLTLRTNYPDPATVAEWIRDDLWQAIDARYPEGSAPDPLDREAAEHAAFAASRTGVYVPRPADLARLDRHAGGDGPPLVVLGEAGIGKSALLANWAHAYRERHPDAHLILHFIGASPYSGDWAAMLRRLLGELNRRLDLQVEIPDPPEALRLTFANALSMAAAKGRVILVLDALNQLQGSDVAPDLDWLPPVIPENIRLILSTLPGRGLDTLIDRAWRTLSVTPLALAERRVLIRDYLARYAKRLSPEAAERIACAAQAANPLYLRALLDELRVFGERRRLPERIADYLTAPDLPSLYQRILARWKQDYEGERPNLVRDAMRHLWAARRGLAESELLALLGTPDSPLPQAYWSPLALAAEGALIRRGGLIGFGHEHFRQAVQVRYLPGPEDHRAAHLALAEYFQTQPLGPRQIDELPWQLQEAQAWSRLYELLADLAFLHAAWQADQYAVKGYWAQVEANSDITRREAYRAVVDSPGAWDLIQCWDLALLLQETGELDQAKTLWINLVDRWRQAEDRERVSGALGNLAVVLADRGDLAGALALMQEQEGLARELGRKERLSVALGNQATILYARGDWDVALALLKEQEELVRELAANDLLRICLANQSVIMRDLGQLDEALALVKDAERLARELGSKDGIMRLLGNRATILKARGHLDEALALRKEQESVARELGSKDGLIASLGGQAKILQDRGDLDAALVLSEEEERLCRELGSKDNLQRCLGNQAQIHYAHGYLDRALGLMKEHERLARELGSKDGLQASLGSQAVILRDRGDLDGALELMKEQERLCRELGSKEGLRISLGNQAVILTNRGDLDGALELMKEQERLCRELGSIDGLRLSLGNQALILETRGDLDGALVLRKQEERLCRELGSKDGLSASLGNQAVILYTRGDLDGALALSKEEERLCREMGSPDGLRFSLSHQAMILRARGNLDEALALHEEEERVCRELGCKDGLIASLGGQALILRERGDLDGALALHKDEETLCRQLGSKRSLSISLGNHALILRDRGDLDEALALMKEQERLCRELGSQDGIMNSLGNQAVVLRDQGDLPGALALMKQQEQLARGLTSAEGLAMSLANQAELLGEKMNQPDEALPLVEEAYRLAAEHGLKVLAEQIRPILDSAMARSGGG